jgi:dTDP-L-rhamnose 4-epimerase
MDRGIFEPVCPRDGTPLTAVATEEDAPPRPTSVYGASKFAQEQLSLLQMSALTLSCTALRFQNVYGPGQSLKNPYTGILAIFTNLARKHETIQIFEDGLESRDFVFIDDVVSAIYASLIDPRCGCFVYNVGAGVPVTVLEIARRLVERLGSRSRIIVSGAYRVGDIRHNIADIKKARRELNYDPKTSFATGLEQFVAWALEAPAMDTGYRRSLSELEEIGLFRQCSPKSA